MPRQKKGGLAFAENELWEGKYMGEINGRQGFVWTHLGADFLSLVQRVVLSWCVGQRKGNTSRRKIFLSAFRQVGGRLFLCFLLLNFLSSKIIFVEFPPWLSGNKTD